MVPDHPVAHFNLSLIYVAEENYLLAEKHLAKTVLLDPNNIEALRQLGQVYVQLGQTEKAMHTYQQAINLNANLADVHHNLAILYLRNQDRKTALVHFTEALKLDPRNDTAKHMVMALSNTESNTAPPTYITQLFNQYADYYDEHLKTKLKYNAPGLLRNAMAQYITNDYKIGRVLDLGCGTGLCGIYFRDLALELIGVDLSPKMIEKAKLLDTYEKLLVSDINDYLDQSNLESFNIIIAADVLVYMGDLERLFQNIARVLALNGRFAFTTEIGGRSHYQLQPTGRFAHSSAYIHELAKRNQLNIAVEEQIVLRKQDGMDIQGQIWVLLRSDLIAPL
jgi:predicted TPR repeat methyltransferase